MNNNIQYNLINEALKGSYRDLDKIADEMNEETLDYISRFLEKCKKYIRINNETTKGDLTTEQLKSLKSMISKEKSPMVFYILETHDKINEDCLNYKKNSEKYDEYKNPSFYDLFLKLNLLVENREEYTA